MKTVLPLAEGIHPEIRLPVADLSIATLKHLSKEDYASFAENLKQLINADKQIDLFEYTLQRMVQRRLEPTPAVIRAIVSLPYTLLGRAGATAGRP